MIDHRAEATIDSAFDSIRAVHSHHRLVASSAANVRKPFQKHKVVCTSIDRDVVCINGAERRGRQCAMAAGRIGIERQSRLKPIGSIACESGPQFLLTLGKHLLQKIVVSVLVPSDDCVITRFTEQATRVRYGCILRRKKAEWKRCQG